MRVSGFQKESAASDPYALKKCISNELIQHRADRVPSPATKFMEEAGATRCGFRGFQKELITDC